jgi:hypothetical protein
LFVCFVLGFFPVFFLFVVCLFCYCGFSIFISIPIIFFVSILPTLPSSSSHSHSHPLHSLSFSCAKSIALLPNNSFCLFSSTLFSCPHCPLLFSPYLSPDYSSLLHNHCPLTNLLYNFTQPQATAIPDTSTLHYNSRNTSNTHKDHKTQQLPHCFRQSPTPLPTSPFSATLSNFSNFNS